MVATLRHVLTSSSSELKQGQNAAAESRVLSLIPQDPVNVTSSPVVRGICSPPTAFDFKNSTCDNEVRPHQLSITLNGEEEIELEKTAPWLTTGYEKILFLAAAFYPFIIDIKVIGLQSCANDRRRPLCKIDERCAIMGWTHERRGHAANDSLETSIARQAGSQKARSPFKDSIPQLTLIVAVRIAWIFIWDNNCLLP